MTGRCATTAEDPKWCQSHDSYWFGNAVRCIASCVPHYYIDGLCESCGVVA